MAHHESGSQLTALLVGARGLLDLQAELGHVALDVSEDILRRPAMPAAEPSLAVRPKPPGVVTAAASSVISSAVTDPAGGLVAIRESIGDCERCKLSSGRTSIVFGVGNPSARLMFVGEGPGRDEDLQGEPFVGQAGQLLDKMVTAMGLSRSEIYIANIVKCRPPRNRDPEPDEVQACEQFLKRQIEIIQPEVVVALGRYAAQTLLDDSTSITKLRGQWREYAGIPLMPTFHPAYLLRNGSAKRPAWDDLKLVMVRLGLEDPRRKG